MAYRKALREENMDKFMDFLNERVKRIGVGRVKGQMTALYREWIKDG